MTNYSRFNFLAKLVSELKINKTLSLEQLEWPELLITIVKQTYHTGISPEEAARSIAQTLKEQTK